MCKGFTSGLNSVTRTKQTFCGAGRARRVLVCVWWAERHAFPRRPGPFRRWTQTDEHYTTVITWNQLCINPESERAHLSETSFWLVWWSERWRQKIRRLTLHFHSHLLKTQHNNNNNRYTQPNISQLHLTPRYSSWISLYNFRWNFWDQVDLVCWCRELPHRSAHSRHLHPSPRHPPQQMSLISEESSGWPGFEHRHELL